MPELVIYLTASDEVIRERLAKRDRVNIATSADAGMLKTYLEEWLGTLPTKQVLEFDVSAEDSGYKRLLQEITSEFDNREIYKR
jgi:deoxyadenosine/deoxycytidine kinase